MDASRKAAVRMLTVVAVGSMTQMTGRLLFSPLVPAVIRDFQITSIDAGVALTLLWGGGAVVQYPSGRLSDQLSRKTMLVSSYVVLGAGVALLVRSGSLPVFLVGACIFGIGTGLFLPASIAQISDLFIKKRAQALGINVAAVNLGGILAASLASLAIAREQWQLAYLPLFPVVVALFVATHRWSAQPYVISGINFDPRETGSRLVESPQLWRMICSASLFSFAWQGVVGFLPVFLRTQKGYPPELANMSFGFVFAVGAVANPIAGRIGDEVGYLRTIVAATLLSAIGLVALLVVRQDVFGFVAITLVALGLAAFWPVNGAFLMAHIPKEKRGGDYGAVRTIYNAVGSLGPICVGVVAYYLDYSSAFVGLAVILCTSGLVAYRVPRGAL